MEMWSPTSNMQHIAHTTHTIKIFAFATNFFSSPFFIEFFVIVAVVVFNRRFWSLKYQSFSILNKFHLLSSRNVIAKKATLFHWDELNVIHCMTIIKPMTRSIVYWNYENWRWLYHSISFTFDNDSRWALDT